MLGRISGQIENCDLLDFWFFRAAELFSPLQQQQKLIIQHIILSLMSILWKLSDKQKLFEIEVNKMNFAYFLWTCELWTWFLNIFFLCFHRRAISAWHVPKLLINCWREGIFIPKKVTSRQPVSYYYKDCKAPIIIVCRITTLPLSSTPLGG